VKRKSQPSHVRGYGRIPDTPDKRDFKYRPQIPLPALPKKVDLRRLCPRPFDQGKLGSCTANAVAAALMFDLRKQRRNVGELSRLFLYYHERVLEGTVKTDAGAQARDGMKVAAKLGVCSEGHWRYIVGNFRHEPPAKAYLDAVNCRVASYHRLSHDLYEMKECLASGYPFVFGITVYASFESKQALRTGVVDLPAPNEKAVGGHSILAVGYDDSKRRFIALNSWGASWSI
jgi:C1A family cysteine protease